nr:3'(2'),5'-bisphosphate nucleotidase CysQ [Alsobacter ponti]
MADIASRAGAAIMGHYGACEGRAKEDGSPVTAADEAADALIGAALAALLPGVPVLSEESAASFAATDLRRFVLVDPLDGTKEFLTGNGEFTVNIAVIEDGAPVSGVVYAPALGRMWLAGRDAERLSVMPGEEVGQARDRRAIRVRRRETALVAVASRSHRDAATDAWLSGRPVADTRSAGSSLKFCLIAEGEADIYPRLGPTMEWDTAAGHAVVTAAGGVVLTPEGAPFRYGKAGAGFRNGPFVAASDAALVAGPLAARSA